MTLKYRKRRIRRMLLSMLLVVSMVSSIFGPFRESNVVEASIYPTHVLSMASNDPNVYESSHPGLDMQITFNDIKHLLAAEYTPFIEWPADYFTEGVESTYSSSSQRRLYFNVEEFLDKGEQKYGDYESLTYVLYTHEGYSKNVKYDTKNPSGNIYYREWGKAANVSNQLDETVSNEDILSLMDDPNSVPGYQTLQVEFRYSGFTLEGALYTNIDFPNDAYDGYDDNYWINEPWNGIPDAKAGAYNDVSLLPITPQTADSVYTAQENISEYIGTDVIDKIARGELPGLNRSYLVNVDKTLVADFDGSHTFISALGIPTAYSSERKRVWHYEGLNSRSESRWYETFNLDRADEQVIPPIELEVVIKDKQSVKNQIFALEDGDSVILPEVHFNMTIADEHAYILHDKPSGYTDAEWLVAKKATIWDRDDLSHWLLDIEYGGSSSKVPYKLAYKVNNSITDPNEYYSMNGNAGLLIVYDLEVSPDLIDADGNLLVTAEAQAVFAPDDVKSMTAFDFDAVEDTGIMSMFTTNDTIGIFKTEDITGTKVAFNDRSTGNIGKYDYQVFYQQDPTKFTTFSVNTMNEEAVSNLIAQFMRTTMGQVTLGMTPEELIGLSGTFRVIQTVSDNMGRQDTYEQATTVVYGYEVLNEVYPDLSIADEIWDIQRLPVTDNTDLTYLKELVIKIDGRVLTPGEQVTFLSGNWDFGLKTNDTFHLVELDYTSLDDITLTWIQHVKVKSTLPRPMLTFDGTLKENRKIKLTDTTNLSTSAELMAAYPITNRSWNVETIDGDDLSFYEPLSTSDSRSMQSSSTGHYRVTLNITNAAGRTGSTSYEFYVMPDYKADIVLNGWNFPAMTRGDALNAYASVQSLDGDNIISKTVEIWTDSNKDGQLDRDTETLVKTYDFDTFMTYVNEADSEVVMTQLGHYSFVITAVEEFGEDYIPELVASNQKTTEVIDTIRVQNLRPLNTIFTEDMQEYPTANVMILMDPTLSLEEIGSVNQEVVNLQNELLLHGIKAEVGDVDLTTYTYEEWIETSQYYGSSYPPVLIPWVVGAKTGDLDRVRVTDNDYQSARTGYTNTYTSQNVSVRDTNTQSTSYRWNGTSWVPYSSYSGQLSNSKSYSSGGLSGTLYKDSSSARKYSSSDTYKSSTPRIGDTYTHYDYWEVYYRGTISGYKSTSYTYYVTVHRYTGFFEGWVREIVKQDLYHNYTADADKYIIYVSKDGVSVPDDLSTMQSWGGTNLITIGSSASMDSIDKRAHYEYSDIKTNLYEALDVIKSDNPYNPNQIMMVLGEPAPEIYTSSFDYENDPIVLEQWQVVHDQYAFDNPTGLDPKARAVYADDGYTVGPLDTPAFANAGTYTIYRELLDGPVEDSSQGLYSNVAQLEVLVVRKPVAMFNLDWTYDQVDGTYEVAFVDSGSYDPDYQYSRDDRGIVGVKVTWWDHAEPGTLYYAPPTEWQAGHTYTVEYVSEDVHALLSDAVVRTYTMPAIPPIQFDAEARTLDPKFDMAQVPAREFLELYNVWTRHAFDHYLEVGIYDETGTTLLSPLTRVDYLEGATATRVGTDYTWNNIMIAVPEDFADGDYVLNITAKEVIGGQETPIDFSATVYNPIWESYESGSLDAIPDPLDDIPLTYMQNEEVWMEFDTSVYTDKVRMEFDTQTYYLFDTGDMGVNENGSGATFYIDNAFMTMDNFTVNDNGDRKVWRFQATVKNTMADGTYSIVFNGYDVAGNYDTTAMKHGYNPQSVNVDIMNLNLMDLRITEINDIDWKYLFELPDGQSKNFIIPDEEFAVYQNTRRNMIAMGYKVDFEIDSTGLNMAADTITVRPSYYLLDDEGTLRLVDVYVETLGNNYELASTTSYADELITIVLDQTDKGVYEADPTDLNSNTWYFDIELPHNARFAPVGDSLIDIGYEHQGSRLLVVLDIEGNKASNGGRLNYTLESADWATSLTHAYGYEKVTNQDLLGHGVNKGETYWLDTKNIKLDDIYMNREW